MGRHARPVPLAPRRLDVSFHCFRIGRRRIRLRPAIINAAMRRNFFWS